MRAWPYLPDTTWRSAPAAELNLPRISVITASFNQGRFIEETILSVIGQNYPNLQYIVVDNCSSDETHEVLERYRDKIDHLIVEQDSGQSNALNKGFALADGEILTWLNADDMFAPGALHHVARAYAADPRPDIVAGSLLYRVGDDVLYEHITGAPAGPLSVERLLDIESDWMLGQYFYQPEVFFTREIFERAGGCLDETLFYSMDYDLWVRMAAAGAQMSVIGAPLAIFRGHPDQKTSSPDKFLPELRAHSERLRAKYGVQASAAKERAQRPLNLVFIGDVPQGGASLAHARLRRVAGELGHEANVIHLLDHWSSDLPSIEVGKLKEEIKAYKPDIVIVGNIHGVGNAVDVLKMLSLDFNIIFYAHDMWMLTGRCAYTRGCEKLLSLCDHRCPTFNEYPQAKPEHIADLHRSKLRVQSLWDLRVFTNSHWMADNFDRLWRHHGLTAGAARGVTVLPPICDVADFLAVDRKAARARLWLPPEADIIVCSANNFADARKGYAYLLDAIEVLSAKEHPPLVIMAGWADIKLRELASRYDNVAFLGHVPPGITPLVYGAADVLMSAAQDEAFGMVYVEAAAAGAQCVTFRSGGVADAIAHGVSGMLAAEFSGAALAETVLGLLDRKRNGEDLSRSPRIWAEVEHSNIAAARRFTAALAESEPAKSETFIRVQLHRRRPLSEAAASAGTQNLDLPVCTERYTSVRGLGDVKYSIFGERIGLDFRLIRLFFHIDRGPLSGDEQERLDFKIIQRGENMFVDLRPHESLPPIYSHAFVEKGAPFFCDEWGPTLIMRLGSSEDLSRLEACLPKTEVFAFRRFAGTVDLALANASIAASVEGATAAAGFDVDIEAVRAGFRTWRMERDPPALAAALSH